MSEIPDGISVIICCYNSVTRLPATLQHLAAQVFDESLCWEVIVVDNASTDGTGTAAQQCWEANGAHGINLRVTYEARAGLIHARKRGIATANFAFLLFCDDDNWLADNYIQKAFTRFSENPGLGALGGNGVLAPELPAALPGAELSQLTVSGPQYWASSDHWVYGAGSIYRKAALDTLLAKGWEQITLGRSGVRMLAGDDVEICFMLHLIGYEIAADEELRFQHFLPLARQQKAKVVQMAWGLSYSYFLLQGYLSLMRGERRNMNSVSARLFFLHLRRLCRCLLRAGRLFLLRRRPTILEKCELFRQLGMLESIVANARKVQRHQKHIIQLLSARYESR